MMSQSTACYQQNIVHSTGLVKGRHWKTAVVYILLPMLLVLLNTIVTVRADGLFDFQMKLAEKGNPEAQFKIGEMYETGFGTKKNMKLAIEWTAKAADQGHITANFKQLYWDMLKNGITKINKSQYDDLVSKAKTGSPAAQFYLGKMYAEGAGVTQDYEVALDWLNKATLQGVLEAERESIVVKEEMKRAELSAGRAEQERQAALKAKAEEERKREAESLAAQKKADAERATKQAEDKQKKQGAAKKADDDKSRQAEQAAAARQAAAAKQREQEALMKQRETDDEKRKAEFESDPCSGKSARFLSTCR